MTSVVGFAQRMTQAARYVISGVRPDTWFGPMQPLAPMAPQQDGVKGRRWDYPTGINLNYVPRSDAAIGFGTLRALADSCDLLRIAIESRKDQMASLEWIIRPKKPGKGMNSDVWYKAGADAHPQIPAEQQGRIDKITKFFQYPDRENPWDQWLREWMEDVFVIDAPAMQRVRTRGGELYGLELIDGATIKPLLAADGRRPKPPDPAYQQILHGIPAADYTTEELIYCPWNTRTNRLYGYSKVEQILITVNTSIRRSLFQLNYYTEGTQPDAFMGLPKEWTMEQIKDFQDYMDSLLQGNLATRRHLRFVPSPFDYQETKTAPLKDTFDEYLARIICFTFAIAADPFIEHVSRGAVEKSHTRALEEGLEPNQSYVKTIMDRFIEDDFKSPDLEFKFVENREQDPKAQMEIDVGYAKAGLYAIDEIRIARGKVPLGGPASIPMLATATGYVPLSALTMPGAAENLAAAGGPAAQIVTGSTGGRPAPKPSPTAKVKEHDHSPSKPGRNEGEDDEEEDSSSGNSSPSVAKAASAPAVNEQASAGGEGTWWPVAAEDLNEQTTDMKARPRKPTETESENSDSPPPNADVGVGLHPAPQTQPALDYYPIGSLERVLAQL